MGWSATKHGWNSNNSGITNHFIYKTGFNAEISKQAHPAETMGWGSQTVRRVQRQPLQGKGTLRYTVFYTDNITI